MFGKLVLVALAGCTSAVADTPTPAPAPPGAIAPQCLVRTELTAKMIGETVDLTVTLVNTTGAARTVTLTAPCPGGIAPITGPTGFDPLHTCRMSACKAPTQTRTVELPADRTPVVIERTKLPTKGDRCNAALPVGSTFLRADAVSTVTDEVCGGAQVHLLRGKSGAVRIAKLTAPAVPTTPAPKVAPNPEPAKPAKVTPGKRCPACGFGCTNGGTPSSRRDANGCRVCACDKPDLGI